MSAIAIGLNLLLAGLLAAALALGWRLNLRLKALKASQEGFAKAVAELDQAARRAESGLAELRAATDEATEALAGRIEKARALATKLERLAAQAPASGPAAAEDELELNLAVNRAGEARLGSLLAQARQPRPRPQAREARPTLSREAALARGVARLDEDLFEPRPEPEPFREHPSIGSLGLRR